MSGMPIEHRYETVNGVRLHVALAGAGPPLVLLHGYPQTWFLWRKVAPLLAKRFTLIMPDLRGYGDSGKPQEGYDKRTIAADIRALAERLGLERFGLVGHDRGGRVAHRYALDHGATLAGVSLLDILPTRTVFDTLDREVALNTWHWLFLPVPDLAERLISADPEAVLRFFLRGWAANPHAIEEAAVEEYLRCFRLPGTIRATCADYRAGATVDLEQDADDEEARIEAPLQVLWGSHGKLDARGPLEVWRGKAASVEGHALDCGHFLPEEDPEQLARALGDFFTPLLA